ncbi:MAG: SusC/RagA family TonB-linked outer membrane protein [Bacteroidota bacterium]
MNYFTIPAPGNAPVSCLSTNSKRTLITRKLMRIGFIFVAVLLTTAQLLLALPVSSQKISTVEVKLELKNETLLAAFKKIEQQTPFRFVYRKGDLMAIPAKSIRASTYTVEQALNLLLENTDFSYKQIDNNVLIGANDAQPAAKAESKAIADIPVKGRVTDKTGETLPGVSVRLKGTSVGTTTDINGNYSINIPEANSTIVFTYIGYVTQEVQASSRTTVNVVLEATNTALNEVVVTALGISRESKSLTYSAQNINSDQLNKTTGTNMVNSLQGKVAGLTITRSTNGVGGGSTVLLRGNRSITGNNAPLYVTDGVPGGIGFEDGDNIESITVLKGAAAAALYGSAGQNGVILITTKKGKAGGTSVEFNGGVLLDQANLYHELQYEYGQGDAGLYVNSSEHSFGPRMTGQTVTLWNGQTAPLTAQRNQFEDFLRTGTTFNNSININTGTEKMQTYFSYGNIRAQGIMKNNDLNRHNLNLRITNNITKKLSLDTKLTYNFERVDNSPVSFAITSIYRTPVSIPSSAMSDYLYTDANGNPRQNYWKPGSSIIGNPYFYMYRNLNYDDVHRAVGLISAKYDFNSWLSLQVRGNVNQSFASNDSRIYSDSYHSLAGSNYSSGNSRGLNSNADGLLTFKRDLTKNFNLSGHIGGYVQGSRNVGSSANANGLNKQDFFYLTNAKAPQTTNSFAQSPLIQSLYSAATIAYKNYLYLDLTGRNDWSSALPKGEESVFYPSVGLTAIVSDMVTMPSWISYAKARVSTANAGNGGNAYFGKEYYTLGVGGLISTPTIQSFNTYKPELTKSFEAGLDWRFFNNRLGFDVTYYKTRTENQLLLIGAPSASTYNQRYINAGLIKNDGIELIMNATPLKIGKFSWDAMLNFSKNNNIVSEITPEMKSVIIQDDDIVTTRVEEGRSFGDLYVKGWQRDAQGRKLVDNLGRPLLTPGKTIYAGNFNPDFMAGLSNTFSYTNFSFSFQLDHRNGGYIIGGTQPLLDADGHSARSLEGREGGIVIDAYLADGTKNTKSITSQAYFSAIGDRKPTGEEYNYSATNTRLREVTLDYTIPTRLLGNSKYIKGAKISLIGRNLFFLQRSAPFDPDIARGRGGNEYTALPFTKSYGLNLRASF